MAALSADDGELTRNAIVDGVTKFLSSGSMIKEIRERTTFDERSLMAPEPALASQNGHAKACEHSKARATVAKSQNLWMRFSHESDFHEVNNARADHYQRMEKKTCPGTASWKMILKTLRELIDKTKRSEEEHG